MQKVISNFSRRNFTTKRKKFYQMVDIMEVSNKEFKTIDNIDEGIDTKLISLSKLKDNYYHILLDKKKCLSAYQDDFHIPSKLLAIGIAAEYQRQKEYIDFNYMPLTTLSSFCIKISKSQPYKNEISSKLYKYIQTDQICYLDHTIDEELKRRGIIDINFHRENIFSFLKKKFNIELKKNLDMDNYVFNFDNQFDQEIKKIETFIHNIDPWILGILETLTGVTKSLSVSLALLFNIIDVKQSFLVSNCEEIYQQEMEGFVEGYHDITNEANLGKLYSAMTLFNLL